MSYDNLLPCRIIPMLMPTAKITRPVDAASFGTIASSNYGYLTRSNRSILSRTPYLRQARAVPDIRPYPPDSLLTIWVGKTTTLYRKYG
jgi:hypothetical protein